MPAEIGEMFYTGEMPWHGQGIALAKPATLDEALKVGGLRWTVDSVELLTADDPPTPVPKRKALVRTDRPPGHDGRVLGVAHRGFQPVQNEDGGRLFDAIFGGGRPVYHTGGYLGDGQVVWLLAKIDRPMEVAKGDVVCPYALFANSHDGSMAFHIRLTTVRVVCRNTLSLSLRQRAFGQQFKRAHQGSLRDHAAAAMDFFSATLKEFDVIGTEFKELSRRPCDDGKFASIVLSLLPDPKKPRNAEASPGLLAAWEKKLAQIQAARSKVIELRASGMGAGLVGSAGTYWGALNAVLEFVDHYSVSPERRASYALLGDGMELKRRAFEVIGAESRKAA